MALASAMLARGESVDLSGGTISLDNNSSTEGASTYPTVAVGVVLGTDRTPHFTWSLESTGGRCWEMRQATATLSHAAFAIPNRGQVTVDSTDGVWEKVKVTGEFTATACAYTWPSPHLMLEHGVACYLQRLF